MKSLPDSISGAGLWLYLSIPMWVLGFMSPNFMDGFMLGIIFVPVWGLVSAFVFSWVSETKDRK